MLTIKRNPDEEQASLIEAALEETEGYCPCAIERSDDTKCPCREFREQEAEGLCNCGLYVKAEED